MEGGMLFRRQIARSEEAANAAESLPGTSADGPVATPPTSVAVHGAPLAEIASGGLEPSNLLFEPRLWKGTIERFTPDSRLLAKNLVLGPGAPKGVRAAYNLVRAEALKRLRQNHWNTVAVTSPSRASGNTLTAVNLAISMARDFGQSVLLVELDLGSPAFHRIFGFAPRPGLTDYLLNGAPLSEILLDIGIERFAIIPAGYGVPNSSELLSSPQMAQFVQELKRCQGQLLVLFDLPSVLAVDDAMAFASFVDCALLVVEENETRVEDVRRALSHLQPTKILGIVLNRSLHGENEIGVISR